MDSITILKDLKNLLISRYSDDIRCVILFGSQADGDADKFSDIDLKYNIITDVKLISENDLKTIKGKQEYILQALESGIAV